MSRNPLRSAVRVAVRANVVIEREFARVEGDLAATYLTAQKALQGTLPDKGRPTAGQMQDATIILSMLRGSVRQSAVEALGRGEKVGIASLDRQMSAYGEPIPDGEQRPDEVTALRRTAVQATVAQVDQQILSAQALLLGGGGVVDILGGETRAGVIRPSPVVSTAVLWTAQIAGVAFLSYLDARRSRGALDFDKQAIAALDGRTTECCINVHGQIRKLDEPFKLTGTPRFSDERDQPPFHWRCRTAMALYRADYDDGMTQRLRSAAQALAAEHTA